MERRASREPVREVEGSAGRERPAGDSGLDAMRSELCRKIASGALTLEQPALREHLRTTAMDRMAIDQPSYSAYLAGLVRRAAPEQI